MQTFLPYADFKSCAQCLDMKRLGKQRVEAKQIYDILHGKESKWANHPVVRMWAGYQDALALYHNAMIDEWVRRGYKNTMPHLPITKDVKMPPFIGWDEFHQMHQHILLKKKLEHYSHIFAPQY